MNEDAGSDSPLIERGERSDIMPQGRILLKAVSDGKRVAALESDSARLLYTWLIPHLDINGCFHADPSVVNGKIFTRLKKTPAQVAKLLDDLEAKLLIVRYTAGGDVFLCVPDFAEKQPRLNSEREAKPSIPPAPPELLEHWSRATQDQLPTNSGVDPAKVNISKSKSKSKSEEVLRIISYLNEKAGKNFKPETANTARHIEARLKEGRTVDDFIRVIDTKVAKWKGSTSVDRRTGKTTNWDDFLRPETLFCATNFESYLNESLPLPKGDDDWVRKKEEELRKRKEEQ